MSKISIYLKTKIFKVIALPVALLLPMSALGQITGSGAGIGASINNLKLVANSAYDTSTGGSAVFDVVNRVLLTFFLILATLFLGMMLYAGYNWMTAMGDSEKVTKAKDTLISAVIGIIIILAAYALTVFVIQRISGVVGISG